MGAGGLFIKLLFPAGSANFDTFAMLRLRSMTNHWVRCFDDCYLGDERISMALSPNGHDVLFTSSQNLSIVILSHTRPLSSNKEMQKARWNFRQKIIIFWILYAQETHIFCTMTNASRQHGSVAAAIKTPWRNRIEKPIKIDVSKISCQPQAGHLNFWDF